MSAFKAFFKALYRYWMIFAEALGWVMSRVILTVIYVGMFVPVHVIMAVVRYDPLERKIQREAPTYWTPRENRLFDPERCKRQF